MKFSNFLKKLRGIKDEPSAVNEPAAPALEKAAPEKPAQAASVKPAPVAARVIEKPAVPKAPVSPLSLSGGAKNQSDWLLLQIGKTGRAFISQAEKAQLKVAQPPVTEGHFVRHDMSAALLAYRLVLTAYHVHQDIPSLEALRIVRTAMIGMLHRAVDITVEQTGAREQRRTLLAHAEEQFKFAESEVVQACAQVRARSSEPFAGFYASLVPAFGTLESSGEMHRRYGAILSDLYSKIEAAMAARNQQYTA